GWELNVELLSEVLDIHDYDEAARWMVDHGQASYMGTKQAICAYVARECSDSSSAASVSTPSARVRRTRHWRGPTLRLGWVRDPTTGASSASRRRSPWSRPFRWSSCAATPPRRSPASRWCPTPGGVALR